MSSPSAACFTLDSVWERFLVLGAGMSASVAAALSTGVSSGTKDRAVRGRWDKADLAALRAPSLGSLDDPLSNACITDKGIET